MYTTSAESINLVPICWLQGCEHCNIARMDLVRGVRRKTTQDDIVFKAKLQDLECLVRSEAIRDEHSWFSVSFRLCLRIEHVCKPLQTDLRVVVSILRVCIMPPRSRVGSPVASVSRSWPNNQRKE